MSRWLRDFRLMPIVLIAIGCLFALKTIGLMSDGGYTLGQRLGGSGTLVVTTVPARAGDAVAFAGGAARGRLRAAAAKPSWMQEMFNYPGDITGSIATTKPAEKAAMEKAEAPPRRSAGRSLRRRARRRPDRDRAGPAAVGIGGRAGACWSACRSAGRSSTRGRASSICARAC